MIGVEAFPNTSLGSGGEDATALGFAAEQCDGSLGVTNAVIGFRVVAKPPTAAGDIFTLLLVCCAAHDETTSSAFAATLVQNLLASCILHVFASNVARGETLI